MKRRANMANDYLHPDHANDRILQGYNSSESGYLRQQMRSNFPGRMLYEEQPYTATNPGSQNSYPYFQGQECFQGAELPPQQSMSHSLQTTSQHQEQQNNIDNLNKLFENLSLSKCLLQRNTQGVLELIDLDKRAVICNDNSRTVISALIVRSKTIETDSEEILWMSKHVKSIHKLVIAHEILLDAVMLRQLSALCSKKCQKFLSVTDLVNRDVNFQLILELFPKLTELEISNADNMENWLDELVKSNIKGMECLKIGLLPSYDDNDKLTNFNSTSLYEFCKKQSPNFQLELSYRLTNGCEAHSLVNIWEILKPHFCEVQNEDDHCTIVIFDGEKNTKLYKACFMNLKDTPKIIPVLITKGCLTQTKKGLQFIQNDRIFYESNKQVIITKLTVTTNISENEFNRVCFSNRKDWFVVEKLQIDSKLTVDAATLQLLASLWSDKSPLLECNTSIVNVPLLLKIFPTITNVKIKSPIMGLDDFVNIKMSGLKFLMVCICPSYDENGMLTNFNSELFYRFCKTHSSNFVLQLTFIKNESKEHKPIDIWELLKPHFCKAQTVKNGVKLIIREKVRFGKTYYACFTENKSKYNNDLFEPKETVLEECYLENKNGLLELNHGRKNDSIFHERIDPVLVDKEFKLKKLLVSYDMLEAEFNLFYYLPVEKLCIEAGTAFSSKMLTHLSDLCSKTCQILNCIDCNVQQELNFQLILKRFPNLTELHIDARTMNNWLGNLLETKMPRLKHLYILLQPSYDANGMLTDINSESLYQFCKKQLSDFKLFLKFERNVFFNKMHPPIDVWGLLKPYFCKTEHRDSVKITITDICQHTFYFAFYEEEGLRTPHFNLFNLHKIVDDEDYYLLPTVNGKLQISCAINKIFYDRKVPIIIKTLKVTTNEISDAAVADFISVNYYFNHIREIVIDSKLTLNASLLNQLATLCYGNCSTLAFQIWGHDVNFQLIFALFPRLKKLEIHVFNMENWLNDFLYVETIRLRRLIVHLRPFEKLTDFDSKSLYKFCTMRVPQCKLTLVFSMENFSLMYTPADIWKHLEPHFCKTDKDENCIVSIRNMFSHEQYDACYNLTNKIIYGITSEDDHAKIFANEISKTNQKTVSFAPSAARKRLDKMYFKAAGKHKDEALAMFQPLIKESLNKDFENHFAQESVMFALLVLRNESIFHVFIDKALRIVTQAAESALRTINNSGRFAKGVINRILFPIKTCGISDPNMQIVESRIYEWIKNQRKKVKARVSDMSHVFDAVNSMPNDESEVTTLYTATAPVRLVWLKKNKITFTDAVKYFPHYKDHINIIVEIDFKHLTLTKEPKITNIGNFFRDRLDNLLLLACNCGVITREESKGFSTDMIALRALPKLVKHYGGKSPKAKHCIIFLPKPDELDIESAKLAIRNQQVNYPVITCATVNGNLTFAIIIMDKTFLVAGDAFHALDIFFKLHYSFRMTPSDEYTFLYDYLKELMFDQKKAMINNFLKDLENPQFVKKRS